MSRRTFGIETGQPEKMFRRISEEENKNFFNPKAEQVRILYARYNAIMDEYEKAVGNEVAQETLLQQANSIIHELEVAVSQMDTDQDVPDMEELKRKAKELTEDLHKPKEILH